MKNSVGTCTVCKNEIAQKIRDIAYDMIEIELIKQIKENVKAKSMSDVIFFDL